MPINGSDKFSIILKDPQGRVGDERLDFSFNYQALNEYDVSEATVHEFIDGTKAKLCHFVKLEWEIDFSELLLTPDAVLINKVKNAEYEGREIFLIPHTDRATKDRMFKVQVIEEQRQLGMYYNISQSGPNKDYILKFENVEAITRYDWIDPSGTVYYGGSLNLPFTGYKKTA